MHGNNRCFLHVIGILAVLGLSSLGLTAGEDSHIIALVGGTLIDGTGADVVPDGVVIIEDGKIKSVGGRQAISIPESARIIDVKGGAILPGFINTHVHYGYDGANLAAWAQAGITTVRDESILTEDSVQSMLKLRDTQLIRPEYARLLSSGKGITVPDGYGKAYINSPEEGRKLVNDYIDLGVDNIKITMEDGYNGEYGLPKLTNAEVDAIIETAHRRGVLVSVHTTQARFMAAMVERGVNDIGHVAYDHVSDGLIAKMIEKNIAWIPTFSIFRNVSPVHSVIIDNIHRFAAAGGIVALGDDYGWPNPAPILSLPPFELEMMRRAGMTPMQIIIACTSNSARVCNRDKVLGTLEAGKIADIVVVDGDPLMDIGQLTKVRMVIKDGIVIREAKQ